MHHPATKTDARRLYRFHGGLHLPDNKLQSTTQPVARAALPKRLVLPLQQHIGATAVALVAAGDHVLKGQMIARPQGKISAPLHAPTSGTIVEIAKRPVAHPSGLAADCIVLDSDGKEQWAELPEPIEAFTAVDKAELLRRIRDAGIVGLGGAAFPTPVKLEAGGGSSIHTLVINGAECEPFITCDDLLMREQAERILQGVAILIHLTGAKQCLVGIEDNKPEAVAAMRKALQAHPLDGAEIVAIPTRYPSGGEKQLIRVLTGRQVPSGGIPAHIGIVCHNVGTAAAIADAILRGRPLISRLLTLTGEGIREPRNLEVLIGTPASELIEQAGGYTDKVSRLIMGGPMMGFTLPDDSIPVVKASNCLLAPSASEAPDPGPATPCIRCGLCAAACPVSLLPQQLYWYARARDLEKSQQYNLFDCIECGCCSHVCPAHIPLVQYYRFAKNESWDQERERKRAEQAKLRHEAKLARLARLEAEKQARMKKKKAALASKGKKPGAAKDAKKAAIEAAMKRAAEKKAQQADAGVQPANTGDLTTSQQKQIDQADSRREQSAVTSDQQEP